MVDPSYKEVRIVVIGKESMRNFLPKISRKYLFECSLPVGME